MYFTNTYRWDFDALIALCAPRAVLLGNSDVDDIFPVPGYRRPAAKSRRIYELLGAGDHFTLMETKGPHKDTPELREGAFAWMNRWLKNETGKIDLPQYPPFKPQQLRVFDRLPADAINTTIHESFIQPAATLIPKGTAKVRDWWPGQSKRWRQDLEEKVFRGWPANPPTLDIKDVEDVKHKGLRLRVFDFTSEEQVTLRLWLMTAEKTEKAKLVVLSAVDETGWQEWARELGPALQKLLGLPSEPASDEKNLEQYLRLFKDQGIAFATLAPRGVGPTRWAEKDEQDKSIAQQVRRRFGLLGQTLDGQRAWDVRRGLAVLHTVADLRGASRWLQGKGDMAGIVLYAGLFEPDVSRFDLWSPPASHRQGPTFLNVRRVLDMPQAIALAFPRSVRLYIKEDAEARAWAWPIELQKALGKEHLKVRKVE